jgi:voltage-gated potassium channel
MEEVPLDGVSSLPGQTLGEADIGRQTGLLVVAIRSGDGQLLFNPSAQVRLKEGDILIVIGTPDQLATLRQVYIKRPQLDTAE